METGIAWRCLHSLKHSLVFGSCFLPVETSVGLSVTTSMCGLSVGSFHMGWLGLPYSMAAGFQDKPLQKNQEEAPLLFVTYSHKLYSLWPTWIQGEGTQAPPLDRRTRVKVTFQEEHVRWLVLQQPCCGLQSALMVNGRDPERTVNQGIFGMISTPCKVFSNILEHNKLDLNITKNGQIALKFRTG